MKRRAAASPVLVVVLASAAAACAALTGVEDLREAPAGSGPAPGSTTGSTGGVGGGGTSGTPSTSGSPGDPGSGDDDGGGIPGDGGLAAEAATPDITSCQATGLVAYWQLNEGQGNVAHDCSGNGNDATLPDSVTWTTGRDDGGALQFPGLDFDGGANDSLIVAPSASLDGTGEMTVFVWLNFTGSQDAIGRSGLLGRGAGGTAPDWWLWAQNSRVRGAVALPDSASSVSVAASSTPRAVWMSVALVFRPNGALSLWVNGAQEDATPGTPAALNTTSEGTIRIGRVGVSPNDVGGFAGKMQQIRIFSRALGDQELAALAHEP